MGSAASRGWRMGDSWMEKRKRLLFAVASGITRVGAHIGMQIPDCYEHGEAFKDPVSGELVYNVDQNL